MGVLALERFFHWELEFTDVFHGADGQPLARPGFDAIIGNSPSMQRTKSMLARVASVWG